MVTIDISRNQQQLSVFERKKNAFLQIKVKVNCRELVETERQDAS